MPIEAFAQQNCPIARPLSVLGERWTILVVRSLFLGFRRFDELQKHLGIASNILSARLSTLVEAGIAERRPYGDGDRHEYRLTEKGRDLQPVLIALTDWSDKHMPVEGGRIQVLTHTDCGHDFHPVQTCSHCGGEVNSRNVTRRLGPGATDEQREEEARVLAGWAERRAARRAA